MRGVPGQRIVVIAAVIAGIAGARLPAEPVRAGHVEAELVSEQAVIQPGVPFWVALRLSMDPGWHTYWQNPGDSGLPTTIAWELPPGFTAGPLQWPYPRVLQTLGEATYGYEGEVALLAQINPGADVRTGSRADLTANASWLVCEKECQPGKATVRLKLDAAAAAVPAAGRVQALFRGAREGLPRKDPAATFRAAASRDEVTLRFDGVSDAGNPAAYFFTSVPGLVSSQAAQKVDREGSARVVRMTRAETRDEAPPRLQGVLVITDTTGARALDVDVPLSASGGAAPLGASLLLALLFALLGGVLLNLMPCVLPVLSLKVMHFIHQAQSSRRGAIAHSLVFSLGVIVSFWILAGVLLGLRTGGQLLGWGFQFQNPWVVVVVATLFFLLGLSMFGVFEIGVGLTAVGAGLQARKGWAGSFFSGFLATAVATPCTAPFMGSALGFAFSQPPAVVLAVFTALAAGMALPFVALSTFPGLSRRIPRPGKWMETLKQVMGFPLMASAVWMGSILVSLSGPSALVVLLGAFVACGVAAWIFGRWGGLDRRPATRSVAVALATVLVVGSLAFAIRSAPAVGSPAQPAEARPASSGEIAWETYSPERVSQSLARGKPVFIDFTAAWCLTCQVNERVALRRPEVASLFKQKGIAAFKADWTDRSTTIADAVSSYGRAGIPLYVFYNGRSSDPQLLPEILTPRIVLDTLSAAR